MLDNLAVLDTEYLDRSKLLAEEETPRVYPDEIALCGNALYLCFCRHAAIDGALNKRSELLFPVLIERVVLSVLIAPVTIDRGEVELSKKFLGRLEYQLLVGFCGGC